MNLTTKQRLLCPSFAFNLLPNVERFAKLALLRHTSFWSHAFVSLAVFTRVSDCIQEGKRYGRRRYSTRCLFANLFFALRAENASVSSWRY